MYALIKRLFDLTYMVIALPILAPFMIFIAILILLESEGPPIYRQKRIGQFGKHFDMYKFRTMRKAGESSDFKLTRIGLFLRRASLDELPQLFNVLKGDISLVGPRPLFHFEYDEILEKYPEYKEVLESKPGITGNSQVFGFHRKDGWEERLKLDLEYVRKRSIWFDLYILFKTVVVVTQIELEKREKRINN